MVASAATVRAHPSRRAVVRIGRGPRQCERLLLADLEPWVARGLAPEPVLLLVPSRSLALHLEARLVERFERPVVGVRATTLWGLALSLVERAGAPAPLGPDLLGLLARRHARAEAGLATELEPLEDGHGAALGAVRDLLDAGLEPEHVPAIHDALESPPPGAMPHEVARALAVVRVAGAAARDLDALGGGHRSVVLRRAAEAAREGCLPPCRALFVFGFADATGLAADLLVELLRRIAPATVLLDEPPDPLAPERSDAGVAFSERFRERLELAADVERAAPGEATPPHLAFAPALGGEAEVREVARRLRALLDSGTPPERIGVVARALGRYASHVRVQFARLGVPFSGLAATGPPGPEGRRARALLELLRSRERTPIDRWLEAAPGAFGAPAWEIAGALFARGAGRLEDVPAAAAAEETADSGASSRLRRRLPAATLRRLAGAATGLCALLRDWPAGAAADHAARLAALLEGSLGWGEGDGLRRTLEAAVAEIPAALVLDRDELVQLLAPTLEAAGLDPLGGAGGGVQVLDVVEARSRTFDHLFVLGMNRDVFPRLVLEDAILPDAVRRALGGRGAGVLPDLAEKRVGFDEERFLFAQLLAASPQVTLSWQERDDDNLPLAASPLVARLLGSPSAPPVPPPARQPVLDPQRGPLAAAEGAMVVGLARDRAALRPALAAALAAAAPDAPEIPALAAAKVELLEELDPQRGTPDGERTWARLGPFFGFVGAAREEDGGRGSRRLHVTHLERLAECPWRFFLERLLGLGPGPDPLASLPGVAPRLIGSLAHAALRAIVEQAIGEPPATLEEARLRLGVAVSWPGPARLERLVGELAQDIVRAEGLPLPGLARALAAAVAPILETARRREWDEEALPGVLAAEVEGALTVEDGAGRPRRISFRADRVDRGEAGLRLTDYKSGRAAPWKQRSPEGRLREMLAAVASAQRLQAAAYALAAGDPADEGRYVYLHPELDEERPRTAIARAGDSGLAEVFAGAARAVLAAWDAGALFPRFLLQDRSKGHPHCDRCEVREACLRGDPGARLRFDAWLERHLPRPLAAAPASAAEAALLGLWPLGGAE